MEKSLFNQYLDIHPNFKADILNLPNTLSTRFKNKLKAEKNKTNFLSLISEFRFVEFLVKEGFTFDFDTKYKNLKPDIRIKLNDQEIIGDIKRFNLSEIDQNKRDFFNNLACGLKSIKKPYCVKIKQIKSFEYNLIDVNEIKKDFEIWVSNENIKIGDIYKYENLLCVEITNLKGLKDFICCSIKTIENTINQKKILTIVSDKITAYEEAFIDKGTPFFVCIDLTFDTMIDPEDFEVEYLGGSTYNMDENTESFTLGKFYTDEKFKKIIGILIRHNGYFYWYCNPKHKNVLNFKYYNNKYSID